VKSSVGLDRQGDVVVLRLVGDFHGHEGVLSEALGGIVSSGDRRAVIDFTHCRFLGSAALGELLEFKRALRSGGGDVKVTGVPAPRNRATPPNQPFFEQYGTAAEAVASFHEARPFP